MSTSSFSPLAKKQMIESQSSNGKCYLRLLPLLPNFKSAQLKNLETAIVKMSIALGSDPRGIDVMVELWYAQDALDGVETTEPEDILASEFVKQMMESKVRFGYEELGGVKHIGHYLEDDECEDVYCLHGWSARFILCLLVVGDSRIGASISFTEMFGGEDQEVDDVQDHGCESGGVGHLNVNLNDSTRSKINDQYFEIERLNDEIARLQESFKQKTQLNQHVDSVKLTDDALSALIETKIRQNMAKEQDTVLPGDSSSQVGRYEKRFLNPGTVYNVTGKGKTVLGLESIQEEAKTVNGTVCGYKKTKDMVELENRTLEKIVPINGLANPFKSSRLNLLCHFHTAVDSLRPKSGEISNYDAIEELSRFQSRTPSEELAYQMIVRTFNLKTNMIIANPYKIPFLEIGMRISDDSLAKSMDLLRLEYKILWFEEMKSLSVPDFYSSYRGLKEYKSTSQSKSSVNKANRSKSKSGSDKKSGSLLSMVHV